MANERERWLAEAQEDLRTAEVLLEQRRYNASAFYCQQSAEKALKSVLYGLHQAPWGHAVVDLLDRVAQARPGQDVADLAPCARLLDRHYIGARYPNAYPSGTAAAHYDPSTAQESMECAKRFLELSKRL